MQSSYSTAYPPQLTPWCLRNHPLIWGDRTYLMGVLNVTPDSFSDGGQFDRLDAALRQAHHLATSGADILDIGGQSTRPNAELISVEVELARVIPVIQALRQGTAEYPALNLPISIDTTQAPVAKAAIEAGADVVNDISAGQFDPAMLSTIANLHVPAILMHTRGTPQTMQTLTDYQDLIGEIYDFLDRRIAAAIAAGMAREQIAIDPGIGFAKTWEQNVDILRQLPRFRDLGCPVLVGTSRKSFIGRLLNQPDPQARIWGTAATCSAAIAGGADMLRVHDVQEMRQVCQVSDAIWRHPDPG